eukprot:scaffold27362_cov51-Attheya_sp.AAC.3
MSRINDIARAHPRDLVLLKKKHRAHMSPLLGLSRVEWYLESETKAHLCVTLYSCDVTGDKFESPTRKTLFYHSMLSCYHLLKNASKPNGLNMAKL